MTCGRCGACARWNLFAFNIVSLGLSIVTVTGCSYVCTVARAGGIIAVVALFLGFVGLCLTTFALENRAAQIVWLISKILYCLALVGTCMTFAMFGGENCSYSGSCGLAAPGSVTAIANGAFLIAMVSYCWCVPVPKKPCCRGGSCCDGDVCCGCCGTETGALPEAHAAEKPPFSAAAPQDYACTRESSTSSHQAVPVVVMPVRRTTTIENTPTGKKITEEVLHSDGCKTVTIKHEQMNTGGGSIQEIATC